MLSNKPVLYVANVGESEIIETSRSSHLQKLFDFAENKGNSAIHLCGNLEVEISILPNDESPIFLEEYNLLEPGLDKLIHAAFKQLGLETFFTAREKEVRAWIFKKGTSAYTAAGTIHSAMERGFIKAEVYSYMELLQFKSEAALKDVGKSARSGKLTKLRMVMLFSSSLMFEIF